MKKLLIITLLLVLSTQIYSQKKEIEKQIRNAGKNIERAEETIAQLSDNITGALEALYVEDAKMYVGYAMQNLEDVIAYNKYLYDEIADLIEIVRNEVCLEMEIAAGKIQDETYLIRDKSFAMTTNLDLAAGKSTLAEMQTYVGNAETDVEELLRYLSNARKKLDGLTEWIEKCELE